MKIANHSALKHIVLSLVFTSVASVLLIPMRAAAEDSGCAEKRVPLKSLQASAGTWANLRNNPGSLRYESSAIVGQALKNLPTLTPPTDLCTGGCGAPVAQIFFVSIPNKFLKDYDEREKCAKLEAATKKAPYLYSGLKFDSLDAFNSWYSDFSQGKGEEGTDLYSKCDGVCSPQYTTVLRQDGGKLLADASVVCGPARDKDDDLYVLKVDYLWKCAASK